MSSGHAMLITMGQEEVFSCVELTCNEVDKANGLGSIAWGGSFLQDCAFGPRS